MLCIQSYEPAWLRLIVLAANRRSIPAGSRTFSGESVAGLCSLAITGKPPCATNFRLAVIQESTDDG